MWVADAIGQALGTGPVDDLADHLALMIRRIRTPAYMSAWRSPGADGVRWSAGGGRLNAAVVTARVRGLAAADV
jgi:hypothetical protein